jgi:hypothetical protein
MQPGENAGNNEFTSLFDRFNEQVEDIQSSDTPELLQRAQCAVL